jgi:hypothetical protein
MQRGTAPATSAGRLKTDGRTEDDQCEANQCEDDHSAEIDVSRRDALISIGKYAAFVTPAMTVLIRGDAAPAGHKCGTPNSDNPPHSCIP